MRRYLWLVCEIDLQSSCGLCIITCFCIDLAKQKIHGQHGHIQFVGAPGSVERQAKFTLPLACLCKIKINKRRIRQKAVCLAQVSKRALNIIISQFDPGAFEIGLTEVRVKAMALSKRERTSAFGSLASLARAMPTYPGPNS